MDKLIIALAAVIATTTWAPVAAAADLDDASLKADSAKKDLRTRYSITLLSPSKPEPRQRVASKSSSILNLKTERNRGYFQEVISKRRLSLVQLVNRPDRNIYLGVNNNGIVGLHIKLRRR